VRVRQADIVALWHAVASTARRRVKAHSKLI
jgi:hypothetical protein